MNNSVLPYFFKILYKYLLTSQAQDCGVAHLTAATTEWYLRVILPAWCVVCCRVNPSESPGCRAIYTSTTCIRRESYLVLLRRKKHPVVMMTRLEGCTGSVSAVCLGWDHCLSPSIPPACFGKPLPVKAHRCSSPAKPVRFNGWHLGTKWGNQGQQRRKSLDRDSL